MHQAVSSFVEPPPGEGEGGPAQPAAPPDLGALLGLVDTESSHPWTPEELNRISVYGGVEAPQIPPWVAEGWAYVELQRRLFRFKRRTITRARVQSQEVSSGHSVHLATFTYAPGHQWLPRHIAECVNSYRNQARRDGVPFRYEWVAELQLRRMAKYRASPRECLHYHALLFQPPGYEFPKPDTRGWWPHGLTNVELARNPVGYLAKYSSKGTEGQLLPRGCRISGGGGLSELGRREVRWWMLPRYVREAFPTVGQQITRQRGGGWYNWDEDCYMDSVEDWRQ